MAVPNQDLTTQQIISLPKSSGVYLLHLQLDQSEILQIGRLGEFSFPRGEYFYVGSALGPGGLKARLGRHLHGKGCRHWHIDWLRSVTSVRGYLFLKTKDHLECTWSQVLVHQPGASTPVRGFGASDCSNKPAPCAAHLVWFEMGVDKKLIRDSLPVERGLQVVYQEFPPDFQPDYGDIE